MSSNNLYSGIIYGYYFENMVAGKIYRLDFVYSGHNILPDNDDTINAGSPGEAVDNIYIRCDGTDPIRYSLNAENEYKMVGGVITKDTPPREIYTEYKIIKSINFQIFSGSSTKLAIEVGV